MTKEDSNSTEHTAEEKLLPALSEVRPESEKSMTPERMEAAEELVFIAKEVATLCQREKCKASEEEFPPIGDSTTFGPGEE